MEKNTQLKRRSFLKLITGSIAIAYIGRSIFSGLGSADEYSQILDNIDEWYKNRKPEERIRRKEVAKILLSSISVAMYEIQSYNELQYWLDNNGGEQITNIHMLCMAILESNLYIHKERKHIKGYFQIAMSGKNSAYTSVKQVLEKYNAKKLLKSSHADVIIPYIYLCKKYGEMNGSTNKPIRYETPKDNIAAAVLAYNIGTSRVKRIMTNIEKIHGKISIENITGTFVGLCKRGVGKEKTEAIIRYIHGGYVKADEELKKNDAAIYESVLSRRKKKVAYDLSTGKIAEALRHIIMRKKLLDFFE